MKIFSYLLALIVLFLGISFSILNSDKVTIDYLFGSDTLPLSVLVIISAAIGAIISFMLSLMSILRNKSKAYQLKRRIDFLEKKKTA